MNRASTIILFLLLSVIGLAQHTFVINEDLGHHINIAYMVEESDNAYHIIGLTIETDTSRQSPFVLDLDKNGSYDETDFAMYRNGDFTMAMDRNNRTIITDNKITFSSGFISEFHLFDYNTISEKITLKDSFLFEENGDVIISDFVNYHEDYILGGNILNNNLPIPYKSAILANTNLVSHIADLNVDSSLITYCKRILMKSDSTFVGLVSSKNRDTIQSTVDMLLFNDKLEVLDRVSSGIGNVDIVDAIMDMTDNILFTTYDVFTVNPEDNFQITYWTPHVVKVSKDGNVLWRQSMGNHYRSPPSLSKYTTIIESHNNDGYVVAGSDLNITTVPRSHAVIGKFSNDGDSLWYRKYATFTDTTQWSYHVFNDIIATQDGGYLAVGDETYFDSLENRTLTSLLIIKTDSLGLVVPDSISSVVTINEIPEYNIFPNPTSNKLYINMNAREDWQMTLFDLNGREVLSRMLERGGITYMVDLSDYSTGEYFLNFNNGRSTFSEKIVIGL